MCACINEDENQFVVILFPYQQPVWLQMAFHAPFVFTMQCVRIVFPWQTASFRQYGNCLNEDVLVKPTL